MNAPPFRRDEDSMHDYGNMHQMDRLELKLDEVLRDYSESGRLFAQLNRIEINENRILEALGQLKAQGEKLMALADDLKASIAKLDAETNANAASLDVVQANITALVGKIHNSMTDAEVAEVQAALGVQNTKLAAESARLVTLAKDPTVPVPPPPPALAAARKL